MPNVTVEWNVDVFCAECGAALCNTVDVDNDRWGKTQAFRVPPCEWCMDRARDEGDEAGYERGRRHESEDRDDG